MKANPVVTLSIVILSVIISYIVLSSLALSSIILGIGAIFFYISLKNNSNRKENLNIIRDEDKLYFYLSDDLLFTVNLTHNNLLPSVIKEAIQNEMSTLKEITRKICFINFKNDNLLKELNHTLLCK